MLPGQNLLVTDTQERTPGGSRLNVPDVPYMGRREFIGWFKRNYNHSQRLTMLGPPGRGKSQLGFELLRVVVSPDCKVVVLHGKVKGRDHLIDETARKLNLRITHEWPPTYSIKDRKRNGWILVPLEKPLDDVNEENRILKDHFGRAIHDNYQTSSAKPRITFIDESHQAQADLGLKKDIEAPMMRGRPDNAVWNLVQRGRYVSYHCYEVEHLFIFYDPDSANTQRYSEMGDCDPVIIRAIASKLKRRELPSGEIISECLYMNRSGFMCIVGMD